MSSIDSIRSTSRALSMLLDEFVHQRRYVSSHARAIESLEDLPLRLQEVARSRRVSGQWRAWTDAHRIWFIAAEATRVPEMHAREVALKMRFYDQDGVLATVGIWLRQLAGHWVLYSVLDEASEIGVERRVPFGSLILAS